MTVLVLTCDLDPTTDLVISELNERGVPLVRLDPGDFPEKAAIAFTIGGGQGKWQGRVRGRRQGLPLDQIRSVYYRRPDPFRFAAGMSVEDAEWSRAEARAGFSGVLASLDCRWVNRPGDNTRAACKPVALATAVRCGLAVPRTLITNEPGEARDFINALPGQVAAYKPVGSAFPPEQDGQRRALWTTRVTADEITTDVSRTAHQFQEWIDKARGEVRLTVVENQMFASEIHAGSDASRVDFRTDYPSLSYQTCPVPAPVAAGVRGLMSAFGLRYAAMDFLVDYKGTWHLIDLNPNGQFGFIPDLRGPITHALADLLEGTDT
ncbi:ATP-grasp ribosomal peptide maturase [Kitasatospora sp. MAP5-34]|uniref:ATP-grasp ribosomal peptide maturase n=1 Tax=Kitasatospora sp. MAP5-34 TaxID=3035102 RepID=UPI00247548D3|nr:ATP-grasp ribosomal peptide maturase [Kitasatospora sp. MAP5-34]MDH6579523.1 ATP-grasp ribosomal peptide maturase [Kitasatospora sp. MAP5-34]